MTDVATASPSPSKGFARRVGRFLGHAGAFLGVPLALGGFVFAAASSGEPSVMAITQSLLALTGTVSGTVSTFLFNRTAGLIPARTLARNIVIHSLIGASLGTFGAWCAQDKELTVGSNDLPVRTAPASTPTPAPRTTYVPG